MGAGRLGQAGEHLARGGRADNDSQKVEMEEPHMRWYHYLALFFAGAFLVNSVPHFTNGVSGRPFPSPFASPPGQGLSSPIVNVLWGSFNFIVGVFLCRVGRFDSKRLVPTATVAVGGILMAVMLAIRSRCARPLSASPRT
jgi:hypothetical protein